MNDDEARRALDEGRQLRDDARHLLDTATHGTYRPRVAWAVGVLSTGMYEMHNYWRTRKPAALARSPMCGMSLRRGYFHNGADRLEINGGDLGDVPLAPTWREVAAVLDAGTLTTAHHMALADAMTARYRLIHRDEELTDEVRAQCRTAETGVWATCRPNDPGTQLDLLAGFV
jgi:hypothetical protein